MADIADIRGAAAHGAQPPLVFSLELWVMGLVAHGAQEFVVVGGALHAVLDEFHRFDRVAVGEEAAKYPHAVECLAA